MGAYPLDLVLAIAVAAATVFLGFLPTKNIRSPFFAQEALKAAAAWGVVAVLSPPTVLHFPLVFAGLCAIAWRHFRGDNALGGKMWLSIASGLGISVGIVFILAVTPQAYPADSSKQEQTLLLASMYLGGAVIGLAYVCHALALSAQKNPGITQGIIYRYVGLLFTLVLVRAAVAVAIYFVLPGHYTSNTILHDHAAPTAMQHTASTTDYTFLISETTTHAPLPPLATLLLLVLVMPLLAHLARLSAHFSSRKLPTRPLAIVCGVGLVAEILARCFML